MDWNQILLAVGILGGLGLVLGTVLAVANKIFYVETDPRLEPMVDALPGANCGGCGFAGCTAYAQAVLEGAAPVGLCVAGGDQCAAIMAGIMGVEAKKVSRQVAFVRCSGTTAKVKGHYEGLYDCAAATKVGGRGPLTCKFGCLGFGSCTKACSYNAIRVVDGVAKVDPDLCVGCMACAAACPRNLIVPVHFGTHIRVACASNARGSVTLRGCNIGCIGCTKCEKVCPKGAIKVENNLAQIDFDLCDDCGLCVDACPRHLIYDSNLTPSDQGEVHKPEVFQKY